ncbi:hypothetical protein EJB05_30017, partial [Eragrostis curvula]
MVQSRRTHQKTRRTQLDQLRLSRNVRSHLHQYNADKIEEIMYCEWPELLMDMVKMLHMEVIEGKRVASFVGQGYAWFSASSSHATATTVAPKNTATAATLYHNKATSFIAHETVVAAKVLLQPSTGRRRQTLHVAKSVICDNEMSTMTFRILKSADSISCWHS